MRYTLIKNGEVSSEPASLGDVPWWSFTKTVIAAAALLLVRDKQLSLDDPLEGQPYTLCQLLRHESGLTDYGQLPDYHAAVQRGDSPWPVEELLQRTDAKRLRYAPGSDWAYSNIGYLQVRRLIEQSTNEDLGAALARLVLRPLGLTQTRLAAMPQDLLNVDMGATQNYDPRWVYHGLLVGPLTEAALLLDRLMTGALLPDHLLRQMLDIRPLGGPIAGRPWVSPGYGLGVMSGKTDTSITVAGHTGGGPGSVIAVYHKVDAHNLGAGVGTCAVFWGQDDAGAVEREAVSRLSVESSA